MVLKIVSLKFMLGEAVAPAPLLPKPSLKLLTFKMEAELEDKCISIKVPLRMVARL